MSTNTPDSGSASNTTIHSQARKLLEAAGSPELAKHAVQVASAAATGNLADDQFARQWGFDSYLALTEASLPLGSRQGKNWSVTAITTNRWILWNDAEFQAAEFTSREEAEGRFREMA